MRPAWSHRALTRLPRTILHAVAEGAARLAEGRLVPLSLLAGAIVSAGVGVGVAQALPDPPDTMPASDVKPGMKGYGLTVFSGTTPEKFNIEIIATLHNFRPNQELILIKTPHPRLDAAHTVAGMSGSPIYLNGKMIGAYAYGWLFGAEAIAGVTPIKSMLEELARPIPRTIMPRGGAPLPANEVAGGGPVRPLRAFAGAPEAYDLNAHAKQLSVRSGGILAAPDSAPMARASTPILIGGMGNLSMKIASDLLGQMGLEPLQGGGSSGKVAADAPTKFVDGGAIGVELIRGDVSAMGLGTVTRVSGDKLVAFGHPMLGGGIENLPTAIGKVHWIVASTSRSFKLGEAARSLGALVNDRQAAIVVDASAKAPVFPLHLEILGADGAPKTKWSSEVSADQFMAPAFTAMAIGNAVEQTTSERRDMTWRATSKLKIAKYGTITLVDFGAGNGNPVSSDEFIRGRLVRGLGALLNNPWEAIVVEGIETQVRVTFEREVTHLRGAKVLEPEIDAGSPVRIRLDLQPFQGKVEQKVIEVKVPRELAGKEVEIDLAPGYEVDRPLATPDSLAELVANLPNQTFDPESIVASFRIKDETGAAYRGHVAARLPPGALDTLRPSSQSDAPEIFPAQIHTAVPLKRFVVGHDTVKVVVRRVLK